MSGDDDKRRWTGAVGPRGGRPLAKRVQDKTKKPSSRAWIERQINDPYVQQARDEGWRARAAFKLAELDDRFHLIKRGARVIDLGAAPGGWAQVALKRGAARVVGVDLLPVDPLAGATFLVGDFLDRATQEAVAAALGGPPDLIVSDMAANTTGHQRTDQIRTGALAEAAARYAMARLAPGGAFVTKAFQGGLSGEVLGDLKKAFRTVRHAKPPASRAESAETYLVAQGFRGD